MNRRRYKEPAPDIIKLPSEYQAVEYLETNVAGAYIQTDILYQQTYDYYVGIESYTHTTGSINPVYSRTGISGWRTYGQRTIWRGYDFKCYFDHIDVLKGDYAFLASSRQVLKDGQPFGDTSGDSGNSFGGNICLLNITNNSNRLGITYLKVIDEDSVILYLIPCYRKSDNKPGMYDAVNNKFYTNTGTGEFLVGPNIDLPEGFDCDAPGELGYDNPMKAKFIGYKEVDILPSEYQVVDYLEGNGNQYLQFPFVKNISRTHSFHIKTKITRTAAPANWNGYFGINYVGEAHTTIRLINHQTDTSRLLLNTLTATGSGLRGVEVVKGTKFTLECSKDLIDVNGEKYVPQTLEGTNRNSSVFYLFADNPNSISPCRIHYFSFSYDNDEYMFVACVRKSDNKPGMYDVVNNVFYTNRGTGEFIVGNDVVTVDRLWDYKKGIYNPETGEFNEL